MKKEKKTQEVNTHFLQCGDQKGVQNHEGKTGSGTGSRTHRSTLQNIVENLQPQTVRSGRVRWSQLIMRFQD